MSEPFVVPGTTVTIGVERRTLTLPPPFPEFARTVDQDDRIEPVLGRCPHGVDLDSEFCSEGCRV